MGFFSKRQVLEPDHVQAEELQELRERIMQLEASLIELEKPVRDLEMEWADWFEKFRNLYARITRRIQREGEAGNGQVQAEPAQVPATPNPLALRLLDRSGGLK